MAYPVHSCLWWAGIVATSDVDRSSFAMTDSLQQLTCRLVMLAMFVSAMTPHLSAQAPAPSDPHQPTLAELNPPRVIVKLDTQRMLHGVVPMDAVAPGGQYVVLGQHGRPLQRARCSPTGAFTLGPLKPGDYEIASTEAAAFLRVVPAAAEGERTIEVSRRATIARGQNPNGALMHRLLIGLVIGGAIAIPFSFDEDDDVAS